MAAYNAGFSLRMDALILSSDVQRRLKRRIIIVLVAAIAAAAIPKPYFGLESSFTFGLSTLWASRNRNIAALQ